MIQSREVYDQAKVKAAFWGQECRRGLAGEAVYPLGPQHTLEWLPLAGRE